MNERQIELLKKALELYVFTIQQRERDTNDSTEYNEFGYMMNALEEKIGVSLF